MAVIDKSSVKRGSTQSDGAESSSSSSFGKGTVVDILQNKSLPTGSKRKIDKTEDAWEFAAPPKEGRYSMKVFLAKDPVSMYYDDEKKPDPENVNYTVSFEGKLTNPEFEGVTVFCGVGTRIPRGKNISTAEGWIGKVGYKIPEESTPLATAKMVVKAAMQEPVIDVHLRWNGWSKLEERNVWPNMASFPVDQDGNPMHVAQYRLRDGREETIRAQLKVDHWYGKNEKDVEQKIQQKGGAAAAQVLLLPEEPPAQQSGQRVNAAAQATAQAQSQAAEDDLLILAE